MQASQQPIFNVNLNRHTWKTSTHHSMSITDDLDLHTRNKLSKHTGLHFFFHVCSNNMWSLRSVLQTTGSRSNPVPIQTVHIWYRMLATWKPADSNAPCCLAPAHVDTLSASVQVVEQVRDICSTCVYWEYIFKYYNRNLNLSWTLNSSTSKCKTQTFQHTSWVAEFNLWAASGP